MTLPIRPPSSPWIPRPFVRPAFGPARPLTALEILVPASPYAAARLRRAQRKSEEARASLRAAAWDAEGGATGIAPPRVDSTKR